MDISLSPVLGQCNIVPLSLWEWWGIMYLILYVYGLLWSAWRPVLMGPWEENGGRESGGTYAWQSGFVNFPTITGCFCSFSIQFPPAIHMTESIPEMAQKMGCFNVVNDSSSENLVKPQ